MIALRWRAVRWPFAAGAFGAGTAARAVREAVIVEARGADGAVGLGEAAPLLGRSPDDLAAVERALAALPPLAVETVDDVWRAIAGIAAPAARFAVETALLGVLAARAGCDLAALLAAAAPRAIPTAIVVETAADVGDARVVKVKVGPGDDRARMLAIAATGARLRLDANRSWSAGEVAARLAALADLPIDFVEEPCADLAALAGARLALPIALDETLAEIDDAALARLLAWPAIAALVVKPTVLGGIARCRALAALAGVPVIVSHALEGPIGTAACAELARALAGDCVGGHVTAAGVGAHPALAGWPIAPPQLRGARLERAALPGLGFGPLTLEAALP